MTAIKLTAAERARWVTGFDAESAARRQMQLRARIAAAAKAGADARASIRIETLASSPPQTPRPETKRELRTRRAQERDERMRKRAEKKLAKQEAARQAVAEQKRALREAKRMARAREREERKRRKAIELARAMMSRARQILHAKGAPVKPRPDEAVTAAQIISFGDVFDRVLAAAARRHGVPQAQIVARTREAGSMRLARFEVCWRLKRESVESLPFIGRALNRHHTSLIYAMERFEDELAHGAPWALAAKADSDAVLAARGQAGQP